MTAKFVNWQVAYEQGGCKCAMVIFFVETEGSAMLQYVHLQISQRVGRHCHWSPSNDMLSIPFGKYNAAPCFWAMLFPAHVIPLRAVSLQIGCVSRNNCFNTWPHLGRRHGLCAARWVITIVSHHPRVDPQRVDVVAGSDWRWKKLGATIARCSPAKCHQFSWFWAWLKVKRRTIKKNRRWFGNLGWFLLRAVWRCGR